MGKALGQHFLTDNQVLEGILAAAKVTPADFVVEIGPGRGILTEKLCASAKKVIAIELDSSLAKRLLAAVGPVENLEIINGDALKLLPNIAKKSLSSLKLVSNIPYEISTPLIYELIDLGTKFKEIVLLTQKEVAQKLTAEPGSSKRTLLTVLAQAWAEISIEFIVPAAAFSPPPKVESAVIKIIPRQDRPPYLDDKKFRQLVKIGFSKKRKKIVNVLSAGYRLERRDALTWLKKAEVSPDIRAEDLTLDDWQRLLVSAE